jgi:RimJ/RimL family protein N-acetyltransferase
MELTTSRLRLDRLCADDAQDLFACRADPAVARFQGWRPASVGEARAFIDAQAEPAPGLWFQRAIRLRDGRALIGDLGVCLPATPGDSVEFGISLAPAHQGHGYAREALRALLHQGFDVLGWRRVHASVDPRNEACIGLLQALGMRQEAHFRESLWLHGEWVDDMVFAMLAREWQAAAPRL